MTSINLDALFQARLIVARFGEMDIARWWDSSGMLAKIGRVAVARGLPRTHRLARARAMFAIARARCHDVYRHPEGVTLWELPADIENAFDERWPMWMDNEASWIWLFESLETMSGGDLLAAFASISPVSSSVLDATKRMKRGVDQKAVPLGEVPAITDDLIARLAAGFSKGEPGRPVVPYAKLGGRRD